MRALVVMACVLLVTGCVEVTRFKGDGGDIYYADCDNPVRLQSCRAALESTCSNGYDFIQTATREENGRQVPTKSGYFRCR